MRRAEVWLKQAKSDRAALQRIIRPYKQHKPSHLLHHPAVAVYLLQQSVEKAAKALMIATGKEEDALRKPPYGHDSLTVVLEFLKYLFNLPGCGHVLDIVLQNASLEVADATGARKSVDDFMQKAKKGEFKELSVITPDTARLLVELMQNIHKGFVSKLRNLLRSRRRLRVDANGVEDATVNDWLWNIVTSVVQSNTFSAEQMADWKEVVGHILAPVIPRLVSDLREEDGNTVTIKRASVLSEVFLPICALQSLYLLAALTFPHEASSRYPAPWGAPDDAREAAKRGMLGTKHYTPELGIVAQLPELTSLTELVLQGIKPLLKTVSLLHEAATQDQDGV